MPDERRHHLAQMTASVDDCAMYTQFDVPEGARDDAIPTDVGARQERGGYEIVATLAIGEDLAE